ncbi:hypothetical protein N7471_012759 [Penicillium samsonianum]|uniref:uncharacterized protein n=1 Tax=Penicillium samsonianum TaxID=1882272 RepID=UPI002548EE67|nr:uncharacterized protein N7471_012759 [Penicillium samsonianum]KAJ6125442.1 hypothetical protein N7471_012759 [Penicillium samsonianum]
MSVLVLPTTAIGPPTPLPPPSKRKPADRPFLRRRRKKQRARQAKKEKARAKEQALRTAHTFKLWFLTSYGAQIWPNDLDMESIPGIDDLSTGNTLNSPEYIDFYATNDLVESDLEEDEGNEDDGANHCEDTLTTLG